MRINVEREIGVKNQKSFTMARAFNVKGSYFDADELEVAYQYLHNFPFYTKSVVPNLGLIEPLGFDGAVSGV